MLSKLISALIRAKLLLGCWGFVAHAWAGGLEAGSLEVGEISSNKIEYNYDNLGRRTQTIYPSEIAVHHKYNNEDQLIGELHFLDIEEEPYIGDCLTIIEEGQVE